MDILGFAFLGVLLAGSIAVWARWIWISRRRSLWLVSPDWQRADPATARSPIPLSAVVAICLLWMLIPGAIAAAFEVTQTPSIRNVQAGCTAHLLLLLGAVGILRVAGVRWRHGNRPLRDWWRDIQQGVLGFLASCLPVFLILWATDNFRSEDTQHSYLRLIVESSSISARFWILLAAIVLAPLVEELVFRVVLQTALIDWIGPGQAVCGVALLFAAIHGWPDMLPLIPLALILGTHYALRRSYVTVVLIHMLFNASNLLLALSSQPQPS